MKFDFLNSNYNNLTEPSLGPVIMNEILANPDLLDVKAPYWPTAFTLSPNPIINEGEGNASFTVKARYPEHAMMMDMRAPLTGGRLAEEGEEYTYSGSIADFIAPVWQEKARDRQYKEKLFAKYGNDAALIQGYAQNVLRPRIEAGNMALDYMAVMAETRGFVRYDKGKGVKSTLYKADIPEENFVKAGAKVWNSPDCLLLDQMAQIEDEAKERFGREFAMQWKIDEKMFKDVFLKNKQVIEYIKLGWLAQNGQTISQLDAAPNSLITEENFNRYVVGTYPGLSPIKIVKVRVYDTKTLINPWPDGIATLAPAGYSGEVFRTDIQDEEVYTRFGNKACDFAFARTGNGLFLVMNSTLPDGALKMWQTKVFMSAVPVITDWLFRTIVNTKEATA